MTPEQERVEIRKALESKEAKYLCECAFANAPTWLRNSLDREEQLIAENTRLMERLDEGTELVAEGLLINEFLNRKVAEQEKEIQYRKKYEGFLKSCIACGESLEKTGHDKFEYWLEKYLSTIKIPSEVEAEG